MIRKKKIAGIAVAGVMSMILCVGTTSVLAANNDGLKKNAAAQGVTTKAQTTKPVVKRAQTHDDLVATAAEVGINIDGMTDEQIVAALTAYKQSHQGNTKLDGLPPHEHLIAVATEVGIKIDGMTDKQIEAALTDYKLSHQSQDPKPGDLQQIAKKMGIDATGMTDDQIKLAISEKGKTVNEKK